MRKAIGFILFELVHLLLLFATVYVLIFLLFSPFTISPEKTNLAKTELVYLSTSGIHTDVILPIHHPDMDWESALNLHDALQVDTFQTHLKFGWGDRNFFLKTKNWSDLTAGTLIKTVFGKGPGAMHLILCTPKDLDTQTVIELRLTNQQYRHLCQFIRNSFLFRKKQAVPIRNHPYGKYNLFFESSLPYSMVYTCNTWTNECLRRSGQKACVWTPFKNAIWSKYQ